MGDVNEYRSNIKFVKTTLFILCHLEYCV